ncbi:MAG TPA: hypothetical protein VHW09_12580 [Bryobacteraceae bacterium]|jgi:hypothetical protein|nr:hypothetical protein [Bryobacteraceae bacterium]
MQLSKDLREFIELLNANGAEYVVVGGLAVAWHGHPRFTADIDFLIRPGRTNAEIIVKTLRDFGFPGLGITAEDLCQPDQIVQLGVKPNRIDVLTSIAGVSFEEAWATRVAGSLDSIPVSFIGREELIRNKEAAGRPQGLADANALRKQRR